MWVEHPISDGTITLRCLQRDDVGDRYLAWLHDPEVNRYLEVRHALPGSVDELWSYVDSINRSEHSVLLGIFGPHGGHLGNIKLGPVDLQHLQADIGILLGDRNEWGKGYATMAFRLIGQLAFQHLGLHRVTAGIYSVNLGSIRALEKAGFTREGMRAAAWVCDGELMDEVLMVLTPAQAQ